MLFGVGSSGSVGLQDILQSGGGGNAATTEVSSADLTAALAASKAKPKDVAAWVHARQGVPGDRRRGARARSRTSGAQANYEKSVAAFVKASTLEKNNIDVLKGLAAAYVAQSSALQTQITALQNEASLVQAGASPESTLLPTGLNTPDAVSAAANTQITERVTALQEQATPLQTAADKATLASYETWKRADDVCRRTTRRSGSSSPARRCLPPTASAPPTRRSSTRSRPTRSWATRRSSMLAPGDPLAAQVQSAVDQLEGKTDTTATTGTGAAAATAAATTAAGSTSTTP